MTDTTVADTGQVPVNVDQPASTTPIGSQAPEKPVGYGSKSQPEGRRESIRKAFERAERPVETDRHKATPKPSDARMGHNNPPEPTEKLDLRKPPSENRAPQERGDRGRFAPRQQVPPAKPLTMR